MAAVPHDATGSEPHIRYSCLTWMKLEKVAGRTTAGTSRLADPYILRASPNPEETLRLSGVRSRV